MPITREQLKELALLRLREAETLFDARLYDGVYLCGYAVELALKARICSLLGRADYPDEKMPGTFRTHNFDHLRLLAGMENEISPNNPDLLSNWSIATEWKPERRYEPPGTTDRQAAERMLDSVRSKPHGVLTCISQRW